MSVTERLNTAFSGRYRIERQLGEGGMATVYLAEDLKHERNVALKVLKPELAAMLGGERFLAEIKTTANLQHPHILPLFDSGKADGFLYYVMPFVDGESLRAKLDRERQLGVDEAIDITKAVASALQYAHDHGVIHRDIKPENILIHAGQPVVADFGIALAISAAGGGRMTETGLSLGTPHYMSPEQATADRDLSARSDVYSLACVLYEMLAGDPPHTGPTAQAILIRILTEVPRPVADLRAAVPPHIAAVLAKALEKLPADRFESAEAFLTALGDEGFRHETVVRKDPPLPTPAPVAPSRRTPVAALGVGLVVGVLATAVVASMLRPVALDRGPDAVFRLTLDSLQPSYQCCGPSQVVSKDGRIVAFLARGTDGRERLYVRPLDRPDVRPVLGTEDAVHPFFSHDGLWLGFQQAGAIRKAPVEGGNPTTVVSLNGGILQGADWGTDDTIIYGVTGGTAEPVLWRVSADGGESEAVTVADDTTGAILHHRPNLLPSGEGVVFWVGEGGTSPGSIELLAFRSGERHVLAAGANPKVTNSGHLVYGTEGGSVMAVALDDSRTASVGSPSRLAEGVVYRGSGVAEFDVARTGTMIATSTPNLTVANARLAVIAADDEPRELQLGSENLPHHPRVSPDGRWVVYQTVGATSSDAQTDLWLYDLDRDISVRLTNGFDAAFPAWAPDGRYVYFKASPADAEEGVYRVPADQSSLPEFVLEIGALRGLEVTRPDGEWLIWTDGRVQNGGTMMWPTDGSTEPRELLTGPFEIHSPTVSHDGRWIAYVTEADGQDVVYVRAFPALGPQTRVSPGAARSPRWAPDGRSLYFKAGGSNQPLFRATVDGTGGTFSVGSVEEVRAASAFSDGNLIANWDLLPDSVTGVGVYRGPTVETRFGGYTIWTDALTRLKGR